MARYSSHSSISVTPGRRSSRCTAAQSGSPSRPARKEAQAPPSGRATTHPNRGADFKSGWTTSSRNHLPTSNRKQVPTCSGIRIELRRNLAQSLVHQGRAGETDVILQRALALQHPDLLPSVLNSLTIAFLTQGRWPGAEDAAREAVRVLDAANRWFDPTYDVARVNFADALKRQGRLVEAVAMATAVLSNREARLAMGAVAEGTKFRSVPDDPERGQTGQAILSSSRSSPSP